MREIARKLDRSRYRLLLMREKRRLRKAEINLGFLGWQQAEFFSPELEAQVQQIMNFEKTQADIANRSAELADRIASLQSEKETHQRSLADFLARNEDEAKPFAVQQENLQNRIEERRRAAANFEKASAELDSEDKACEATLRKLFSAHEENMEIKSEILRIGDRRTRINDEKAEVKLGSERSRKEAADAEKSLAAISGRLESLRTEANVKREEFKETDRELRTKIDALESEKAKTQKETDELDRQKTDPYLLIGQALATSDIAPANQPDALELVHLHRANLADCEKQLAESALASQQVDRAQLRAFYFLLAVLLGLIGLAFRIG